MGGNFGGVPQGPHHTVNAIDKRQYERGHKGRSHKTVRDPAMVLQPGDGPSKVPERVDIRGLKGQHHGDRGQPGSAIQSSAAHARAGQHVCDRVHDSAFDGSVFRWFSVSMNQHST